MTGASSFGVQTVALDLPPLVGAFGRRLRDAGLPVSAEHSVRFASALSLTRPVARRRLYWTARAVYVTDRTQVRAFDAVFAEVFGVTSATEPGAPADGRQVPAPSDQRPTTDRGADSQRSAVEMGSAGSAPVPSAAGPDRRQPEHQLPVPMVASDEEVIRGKRFDALAPGELAELYRLMSELEVATPRRRTRRVQRWRHGAHVDLRRTLRASLRTGGDPIRLARRRRRVERRRLVLLCDISGSMEPYARAYLQFLTCAAGAGDGRNEAFVFATRLTRLTRALHGAGAVGGTKSPERAIQRAAATAPDWSSGTRIGDALRTFNDRHGRRGMARGAVVVILSDGWERGEPDLVAREMQRLRRLAYRIVWVNPRVASSDFSPRTGGMAAALPHCDALVSGHNLDALHTVIAAIAADRRLDAAPGTTWRPPDPEPDSEPPEDPWASATPVPGSSVAMPSGYGPSRGRTTPGWGSR